MVLSSSTPTRIVWISAMFIAAWQRMLGCWWASLRTHIASTNFSICASASGRCGWLEKQNVPNTRDLAALRALLKPTISTQRAA